MTITKKAIALLVLASLATSLPGHASDMFGNGTINVPTSLSGGTGTVANLQSDDDVELSVAKNATATIGGFGTYSAAINSVYLFVQYSVDSGYNGTNALKVNGTNTTIVPADRDYGRWAYIEITGGSLLDSANNIAFTATSGTSQFAYGTSAITPLALSTRSIEINSGGALNSTIQNNNTTHAITIATNLVATGAGAKTLTLGAVAGPSNIFSGNITNGSGEGTVALAKTGAGNWSISGIMSNTGGVRISGP